MGGRVVIEIVVEVVVLVVSGVGWVWEVVVQAIGEMVWWVVEEMLVWPVEELEQENIAGSPRFLKSSGKTLHTVSHPSSISAISFCKLAWKNKVGKVVEALTDQRAGRSAKRVKAWMVYGIAVPNGE